jgi:membrane-associated phospholipid phosphatase
LLCGLFVFAQLANMAAGQSDISVDPPQLSSTPSDWSQPLVAPSIRLDEGLYDPYLIETAGPRFGRPSLLDRIVSDHRNYYDAESFRLLAGGFLVGAVFANTSLDRQIQDHFQSSVAGATSHDWYDSLHASKELGNGVYTLPVFATAWAAGAIFDESPFFVTTGRWGERTLRSFLVGAPPLMLAQRLTGGSRPREKDRDSRWLPFQDNNGVSGHSFMSSLPFINAAKMTQRPWLKTAFYAGSLLGPLSRVNDDAHYPSQIALGWWMAYVAASAIDRTEMRNGQVQFHPYVADRGVGGMFELRF